MEFQILIKNGRIIDGTGNPWYHGEIGITNGRIIKIGSKLSHDTTKEIDAKGKIVCPGFIDPHSHTDNILPFSSRVESTIRQGITTQVVGMCGGGMAPIPPEKKEDFMKELSAMIPGFDQLDIPWSTYAEYLDEMDKLRCPVNLVFFVGYTNIRIAGGQGYENRSATPQEMKSMKYYLREAMEAGAFGMSTGLEYAPQIFGSTAEIVELCKVLAEYGGLYFSHMRGEGDNVVKSVKEVIEIVEKSVCAGGQIAHHKIDGIGNWGKSIQTLQLIEEANARGISITCDQYPYNRCMSSLITALPPWAREGNEEAILERLKSAEMREKIKQEIENPTEEWENWIKIHGFDKFFIAYVNIEKWKEVVGKSISEVTKIKGYKSDWETVFTSLIDEKLGTGITIEGMGDEDIERIMTSRYQMFSTDGYGMPIYQGLPAGHPRSFGTYPRVLGRYVREKGVLTLEEAIRKMTSFPAQRLGLRDRGILKENCWADIVIFDPEKVIDKATYEEPVQISEGIHYVIVNGVIVVENGKQKRKIPGKVIRRPT